VDINNGSDENPGTKDLPFKTITWALNFTSFGDTIYIAQGTYSPSSGETFPIAMKDQVKLKGGYAPGFVSRNLIDNQTILDAEQTTRILRFEMTSPGTELEALIIENGKNPDYWGAGIQSNDSSFIMKYCTIRNNSGGEYGAGLYCQRSNIVLENCIFTDNYGTTCGGAIYAWSSGITMTNCLVSNNSANINGGISFSYKCTPVVTNCLFINNVGTNGYGGALSFYRTTALVSNCVFVGNSSSGAGAIYTEWEALPTIRYSNFYNNNPFLAYNAFTGSSGDTSNFNAWGWDGTGCREIPPLFHDEGSGDYHLQPNSPLIDSGDPLYSGYLLNGYWETVPGIPDIFPVDMGYHYPYIPVP